MTPLAWVLVFSPAFLVQHTLDPSLLPEAVDRYDLIGLFTLQDGDANRLVLLYCEDTDSVGERQMARTGFGDCSYPNFFDVYALYQDASGQWVNKAVFGYARVRFQRVVEVAPDHLVLECRPNFMISFDPKENLDKALKRAQEINKPFAERLAFVDGVLTAK